MAKPDPLASPPQPKPIATPTKPGTLPGNPAIPIRYVGDFSQPEVKRISPVVGKPGLGPKGK
jgi:hypothetical protein